MKTGEIFEPEMKIAVKLLQIVGEIAWEGHDHFDEEALPLGSPRGKCQKLAVNVTILYPDIRPVINHYCLQRIITNLPVSTTICHINQVLTGISPLVW